MKVFTRGSDFFSGQLPVHMWGNENDAPSSKILANLYIFPEQKSQHWMKPKRREELCIVYFAKLPMIQSEHTSKGFV